MEPIEPPQPRKSVNKKLAMVIVAVILIVVGFVVAFVVFRKINFKKAPSESKEAAKINILNLAKKGDVKKVLIAEDGATPSEIHIDRGQAISFTNITKKDLNINISNSSFNAGVPIKANSTTYSPIFSFGGTFKFTDTKNATLSGTIIVSGPTPTPFIGKSSVNLGIKDLKITPILVKNIDTTRITITNTSFNPTDIKIKKGGIAQFSNESDSKVTIEIVDHPEVSIPPLDPKIILAAPPFMNSGVYVYQIKENPLRKGKITVE